MKLLLEQWRSYKADLLNEIKMENVTPRFESKAFLKAVEEFKHRVGFVSFSGDFWNPFAPIASVNPTNDRLVKRAKEKVFETLPDKIDEVYKAEALNWIISMFVNPSSENNNILNYKTAQDLEMFYTIKKERSRFLSIKDINSIKSANELSAVIEKAMPEWEKYQEEKAENDAVAGMNKIHEDDDWKVYLPENYGASCKLARMGAGEARWCTSAKSDTGKIRYKNYYKPEDPLIVFISKKDPTEKYQFHYGTNEFKDKENREMDKSSQTYYSLNSIVADSDKLPEQVKVKAKENIKNYNGLKEIIKQELTKVLEEEWSQSERSKRKSKCSNPKGFTMKQFCKNQRTKSKKGEKSN